MKSILGEFSSGVSICRNKGTQSDLWAPFLPGPPPAGGYGPSSGSDCNAASTQRPHPMQGKLHQKYCDATRWSDIVTEKNPRLPYLQDLVLLTL